MSITRLLKNSEKRLSTFVFLYIIFFGLSLVALTIAYYTEYFLGIAPCVLCIYQRFPYFLLIILSCFGICFSKLKPYIIYCITVTLFVACALSFYHSGVERGIFEATSSCAPIVKIENNLSLDEIKSLLYSKDIATCTRPALVIYGLSMTEWNFFFNFSLLIMLIFFQLYLRNYAKT